MDRKHSRHLYCHAVAPGRSMSGFMVSILLAAIKVVTDTCGSSLNLLKTQIFSYFQESVFTVRCMHTDMQTQLTYHVSMWGSLRLTPITMWSKKLIHATPDNRQALLFGNKTTTWWLWYRRQSLHGTESFFACGCCLILTSKGLHFHWLGNAPSRALLSFHTMRFCKHKPKKRRIGKCYYVCSYICTKDNPLMLLLQMVSILSLFDTA